MSCAYDEEARCFKKKKKKKKQSCAYIEFTLPRVILSWLLVVPPLPLCFTFFFFFDEEASLLYLRCSQASQREVSKGHFKILMGRKPDRGVTVVNS